MLQYAQAMIIPIVLGVLISYALEPIGRRALTRWHLPRPLAAAIVLDRRWSAAGGWLLYGLRSQASAIVEQLPEAARRLRQTMENDRPTTATAIQQVQKAATELEKAATAAAPPPPPSGVQRVQVEAAPINIGDYVMWGSLGIAAAAGQLVLILFLVFFLLASGDLYRRKLVKIVGPSLTKKKVTLQILREIDRQIEAFLLVQLFTSTVVAVATWLAFRALGVEQAAVWGLLAGVFNSIPYFGPVIVTGGTAVGRVPAVRQHAHGAARLRRLARDHEPRRISADALADEPGGADERGRDLRRPAVLGLGLERVGDAARGADADGHQGGLRSRRGFQGRRRAARRLVVLSQTPRRHAALLLHDRRLDRIEQPAAEPLGPLHQHPLVDDEAIGSVGQTRTAAGRADRVFEADVRREPREEQSRRARARATSLGPSGRSAPRRTRSAGRRCRSRRPCWRRPTAGDRCSPA